MRTERPEDILVLYVCVAMLAIVRCITDSVPMARAFAAFDQGGRRLALMTRRIPLLCHVAECPANVGVCTQPMVWLLGDETGIHVGQE